MDMAFQLMYGAWAALSGRYSLSSFHIYPLELAQAAFRIGKGEQPPVPDTLSADATDFIQRCIRVNPDDRGPAIGTSLCESAVASGLWVIFSLSRERYLEYARSWARLLKHSWALEEPLRLLLAFPYEQDLFESDDDST